MNGNCNGWCRVDAETAAEDSASKDGRRMGDAQAGAAWELWRQDDNGNRFLIGTFGAREAADAEQRRFEALAHKQIYWVERAASAK